MSEMQSHELKLSRVFQAPIELVFDACTDPNAIMEWWAPEGWSTPHVQMDVRVGGAYRFGMRTADDPTLMYVRGEYLEIERPNVIRFSYIWEAGGRGEQWREFALIDTETIVTLEFESIGSATKLCIKHAGFPTAAGARVHVDGWGSNWDCLETYIQSSL